MCQMIAKYVGIFRFLRVMKRGVNNWKQNCEIIKYIFIYNIIFILLSVYIKRRQHGFRIFDGARVRTLHPGNAMLTSLMTLSLPPLGKVPWHRGVSDLRGISKYQSPKNLKAR